MLRRTCKSAERLWKIFSSPSLESTTAVKARQREQTRSAQGGIQSGKVVKVKKSKKSKKSKEQRSVVPLLCALSVHTARTEALLFGTGLMTNKHSINTTQLQLTFFTYSCPTFLWVVVANSLSENVPDQGCSFCVSNPVLFYYGSKMCQRRLSVVTKICATKEVQRGPRVTRALVLCFCLTYCHLSLHF